MNSTKRNKQIQDVLEPFEIVELTDYFKTQCMYVYEDKNELIEDLLEADKSIMQFPSVSADNDFYLEEVKEKIEEFIIKHGYFKLYNLLDNE